MSSSVLLYGETPLLLASVDEEHSSVDMVEPGHEAQLDILILDERLVVRDHLGREIDASLG
jgi:hypothetical protein